MNIPRQECIPGGDSISAECVATWGGRELFLALYKYVYRYESTSTLGSKDTFDLIDVGPRH